MEPKAISSFTPANSESLDQPDHEVSSKKTVCANFNSHILFAYSLKDCTETSVVIAEACIICSINFFNF